MKIIKPRFLKYILVILLFGIWILFFDDYKWSKQREMTSRLKALQQELQETEKMINEYESKNKLIENDTGFLETIGRNNYYMKRDNEDLYIFLKKDENGNLISFE